MDSAYYNLKVSGVTMKRRVHVSPGTCVITDNFVSQVQDPFKVRKYSLSGPRGITVKAKRIKRSCDLAV